MNNQKLGTGSGMVFGNLLFQSFGKRVLSAFTEGAFTERETLP